MVKYRDAYFLWVATPRGPRPQIVYADTGEAPTIGRSVMVYSQTFLSPELQAKSLKQLEEIIPLQGRQQNMLPDQKKD